MCVQAHACAPVCMHTMRPELVRRSCFLGGFPSPSDTCWWVGDLPGARPSDVLGASVSSRVGLQINPSFLYTSAPYYSSGHLSEMWGHPIVAPTPSSPRTSRYYPISGASHPTPPRLWPGPPLLRQGSPTPVHPPPSLVFQLNPRCFRH